MPGLQATMNMPVFLAGGDSVTDVQAAAGPTQPRPLGVDDLDD